ncbi:DUF87 domain-containing protein [Kineosporia mesophila]|uniref:DUF87 domain-containing protein n=1 Tax=Kineosporia mesophila TaxID=566012 RepID=A0ABP6ZX33_9ACTN
MRKLTGEEFAALSSLRFEWTMTLDDIWHPPREHVTDLNHATARRLQAGVEDAQKSDGPSPLGLVIEGNKGSGKTHLIAWLRNEVQRDDGYFFLVGLTRGDAFWTNVMEGVLDGLWRPTPGRAHQIDILLTRLDLIGGTSRRAKRAANEQVDRATLDNFVAGLGRRGSGLGPEIADTARALMMYGALDESVQSVARNWLVASPDQDPEELRQWGIRGARPIELIAQDIFRLVAVTGHSVLAMDQIDPLIAHASASPASVAADTEDAGRDEAVQHVAQGVMMLRDLTRRTLTVLACQPNTWTLLKTRSISSARDRFRNPQTLQGINRTEIATEFVAKRFTAKYREVGFTPPYPTWPITPEALAEAVNYTPRALLQRIDAHVQYCLDTEKLLELTHLDDGGSQTSPIVTDEREIELKRLDQRFDELKAQADLSQADDQQADDVVGPNWLAAGLQTWVLEQGDRASAFTLDPKPGKKPSLHARLRFTFHEKTESESHYSFRVINTTHAYSALTKLRSAISVSGFQPGDETRNLIIVRNTRWSTGTKTRSETTAFKAAGGTITEFEDEDVRGLHALQAMLTERDALLRAWIVSRRPASQMPLFRKVLSESFLTAPDPVPEEPEPEIVAGVPVGRRLDVSGQLVLDLESLRRHIAVFAGSGSGKTVLLRRIIEECALRGVSSIVLDPNYDLARLGDPTTSPPPEWQTGDAERAREFHETCEVVVWTPLRTSGRPLTFQPLPDFSELLNDADEFQQAVQMAVNALSGRVRAAGPTRRAEIQRAVLKQSIEFFARSGGGPLQSLADLLAELPEQASDLAQAPKIAAEMAQTMRANMVNDPLFGGVGTPVDPAQLLTPADGKRARISVISMIGLEGDEQRQHFISQLQMALFGWFKKHPARDVPLGGLLVMDEAQTIAPSGALTPSTHSTLALASQARKYGLGLIFATQAPRGLHNRIPGNASTQFYGRLNAPAQIQTAREIARQSGGDASDIGTLGIGQFYVGVGGKPFVKIHAPMMLSHDGGPLSPEEVLDRARAGRDADE